ncbi:MAG: hypothetical protein ACT4PZ_01960 [Panacagrimonas sp.]
MFSTFKQMFIAGALMSFVAGPALGAGEAEPNCVTDVKQAVEWLEKERLDTAQTSVQEAEWLQQVKDDDITASVNGRQSEASGENGGSRLATAAEFARRLAFAVDSQSYQAASSPQLTLNLGARGLGGVLGVDATKDDGAADRRWRRFGASLSLGGTGTALDSDADGTLEDAQSADEYGDIVTWEFKTQLAGVRDLDDGKNLRELRARFNSAWAPREAQLSVTRTDVAGAISDLKKRFRHEFDKADKADAHDSMGCMRESYLDRVAEKALSEVEINNPNVRNLNQMMNNLRHARDEVKASVLKNFQVELKQRIAVTLAVSGTQQGDQFGADRHGVSLRVDSGTAPAEGETESNAGWIFNLDWKSVDKLVGDPLSGVESYAASSGYSRKAPEWLSKGLGQLIQGAGQPVVRFEASYTYFDSLPAAEKFDSQAKVGAALEVPIGDKVSIPLGITWANHPELLGSDDEVYGHLGIKYDFESFGLGS